MKRVIRNLDRDAEFGALRDPELREEPASEDTLRFYPHPLGHGGFLAQVLYPNGYVVSVVNALPPCGDDEYEVEVLHCDGFAWSSPRTGQTARDVTSTLRDVFAWPPHKPMPEAE